MSRPRGPFSAWAEFRSSRRRIPELTQGLGWRGSELRFQFKGGLRVQFRWAGVRGSDASVSSSSLPGLTRQSRLGRRCPPDRDARAKPGHDRTWRGVSARGFLAGASSRPFGLRLREFPAFAGTGRGRAGRRGLPVPTVLCRRSRETQEVFPQRAGYPPASRARCLRLAPHDPRWTYQLIHRCEAHHQPSVPGGTKGPDPGAPK